MIDLNERAKGPVEILCKEIGFRFGQRMETTAVFVCFVAILVGCVASSLESQKAINAHLREPMPQPRIDDALKVVAAARDMLSKNTPDDLIASAAQLHALCHELNPEDAYPTNHFVDMVSSCASAIRFGLETPCRSRHAAAAANHIWAQHYGVRLFDRHTPDWQKDWARAQLQEAILLLASRDRP